MRRAKNRITSHERKRFKRILRELMTWREGLIRKLEDVRGHRYSPDYAVTMRSQVKLDGALIRHIDPLIEAASEVLGKDCPELTKIPRIIVKELDPGEKPSIRVEQSFTVRR